jgi:hypothetical protein
MITYKDLQEKGICWTGYKRKKGTKPYEDNSCMKEELEKHHVLAFGRMNPITSGHEAVVNKLHSVAKEHGASHSLVVSHSQDAKKNPLTGEQKVAHAKNAFPGTKVSSASKEAPTILHHAAAAHAAGATHLHVIAGSDRHEEMHNLLHKYNGKDSGHGHYNFKKITVHSSGERDPDAEGTSGMSASKMREHAASGNKTEFHKGAPSKMKPEHKDAMYNDVRKGMNIKEETVQESLRPEMGAGAYVNDFISSTNPRFNNKSKEERRRMAIGAFMAAKARGVKEEVQIDELSTDLLGKYKTAAHANAKASDAAGNYAKGDKRFKGINKATNKQFDNDLKKHGQMKEGTLQGNIGGGDAMNTTTSAPSASTSKDTTMSKKIKGFKFFNGENDKQMNMNQPVKEAVNAAQQAAIAIANKKAGKTPEEEIKEGERGLWDNIHAKQERIKNGSGEKMRKPGSKGAPTAAALKASQTNEESKKEDPPFDGPYKSNFKKPNNPNRTGMDAARSLAQRAMDQVNTKKPVKEAKDPQEYGYEGDMAMNQLKTLVRCAEMIEDCLKPDTDLPEWVQSKITLATDYIQTAADYLYSESEVKEGYSSYSGRSHGHAYGGGGFGKREREDDEYHVPDPTPVAPTPARKYIKGTPENKAAKAARKPINGHPTNVKEETLDEKSDQAKQNKTMKNMMDASRGARYKLNNPVPETDHKTAQAKNVAIGRALRSEATAQKGVNVDKVNAAGQEPHEENFETAPKTVSKLKKVKEENMKSYKEFLQGLEEKLIGKQKKLDKNHNGELDKQDFEMLRKEEVELDETSTSPVMRFKTAEHAQKQVDKLKKAHKDGNYYVKSHPTAGHKVAHSYHSDYMVTQHILGLKEEADHLLEYTPGPNGVTVVKGRSYGADYVDPEGADETHADMKKKEKKPAGRKAGQSTGSYKPRKTMSKLKSAGSTYK